MKPRFLFALGLLLLATAVAEVTLPPIPAPAPLPPPPPLPKAFVELEPEAEASADWPGVEYTGVRAYLYNPGGPSKEILLDGKLHPEVADPEGIKLSTEQVALLKQAMHHREPDGSGSGCFIPHHGIVFYDPAGKPVADLSICFLCDMAAANPGQRTLAWDIAGLSKLMKELGLPVFEDFDEVEAHFIALARQWPEDKVKAKLEGYLITDLFKETPLKQHKDLSVLQGLGERTHPYLLAWLADTGRRAEWLQKRGTVYYPETRFQRICHAFGDTPPAAAAPLLADFLGEADDNTRCVAASTIAKTGAPESIPLVRQAFTEEWTKLNALDGLRVASTRGRLHPEVKAQLFGDVKALEVHENDRQVWAEVLLGLDSNKATEFFLSPEIYQQGSPILEDVLEAYCELKLQLPRERLLELIGSLDRDDPPGGILDAACVLLGRQHHPEDLARLQQMTATDDFYAERAMSGLLAWHDLEGYRERLEILEQRKGFAALNQAQRLHFAAEEFESAFSGISSYLSGDGGDRWRYALAGLRLMKRDKMAAILEEAVAIFGEAGIPEDNAERRKQLETRSFGDLDERLEEERNIHSPALGRYAIEHAGSFR